MNKGCLSLIRQRSTEAMNVSAADTSKTATTTDWLQTYEEVVVTYVMPIITWIGVLFNCASIVFLNTKEVRLRRSLVLLFTFLNAFDSIFLVSTFLVFEMPVYSPYYVTHFYPRWSPYLVPILQTCLTVSVYSTVAIAVTGILIVSPSSDCQIKQWIKQNRVNVAMVASTLILIFSIVFNISRWFELLTVRNEDPETGSVQYSLKMTDLRQNANYVQYYSLIGSGIVMVLIPFFVLVLSFISIHRSMVSGVQRKKTLRLMTIIITMFLICHSPKVLLTVYEVSYHRHDMGNNESWAVWAKVLKEVSQVLLISYSAFNPLAYSGDLLVRSTIKRICCCRQKRLSDIEMMESVGITIHGIDSIEQQLKELDPQSRILTGISKVH